jgi:hypothetical protein
LIDKITVGGKLTDVVYQFQKSKLTKLKYNYEKISIVTLALLMTVGTFYKPNKKSQTSRGNWSSQWHNNWRYLR